MEKKTRPTVAVKVVVEIGAMEVYQGESVIALQLGLDQLPDQVLNSMVAQAVLKLVPAMRVRDLDVFRAMLGQEIAKAFPPGPKEES